MPNPNGVVAGNAQNIPEAHVPRTRSTFPLHYHFFNTHRFGEYMPHFVAEMNKDEKFPIHSSHDLRSYTLDSPLMQSVKRNKDYFLVPMESILPFNWEKFFDNPVRGDDVPDDVGPTVEDFWSKVASFTNGLNSALGSILSGTDTTEVKLTAVFRWLVLNEYFYSNGSLLSSLGCHGSPYCVITDANGDTYEWDYIFDKVVTAISGFMTGSSNVESFTIEVDGYIYVVSPKETSNSLDNISLRHALQLLRDNPTFKVTLVSGSGATQLISVIQSALSGFVISPQSAEVPCNLSRLWAYQLCCAHYFSNDHIDFVYSAELFRDLISTYITALATSSVWRANTFSRNGSSYRYDYLSAHQVVSLFAYSTTGSATIANSILTTVSFANAGGQRIAALLGYYSALFGYRRSLRYLDYFTGSRAQPLAVVGNIPGGNQTNVAVNNNQVSVIDITKGIQAQRFLNSVNRVRHNFEGYLKGIFGGSIPAPDYHNPFYLAHTDDVVFGQETENTATEQMSDKIAITTNLRSKSGNYMFELTSDRPCIAIGITSYDITRIYSKSIERPFFHTNRFDWFNPFMQYIGDQEVYLQELGIRPGSSSLNTMSTFSYALRHMEYKQRYSQCAGGFCNPQTDLENWLFIARDRRGTQSTINPDWIRSISAEFDRFFVSLSGYSLGTYFHFIVDDYNSCNASRPMAFAPQILG